MTLIKYLVNEKNVQPDAHDLHHASPMGDAGCS